MKSALNGMGTTQHSDEVRKLSHLMFSNYVTLSGDSYYGRFGNKVSLSSDGNRLAVSSRTKDVYYDASIQVFEFNGNEEDPSWNMIGNEIQMEGAIDSADIQVDLDEDGDTMITGFSYNIGSLNYAVKARVFQLRNGQWEQIGSDIGSWNSNGFSSDISVSMSASGTRIAVAFSVDSEINLYDLVNGQWKLIGQINGKFTGERLGAALALSSDGKTLVIGAPNYSTKTLNEVGCARVYRHSGNEWVQIGSDIVGDAAKDRSGASLDISANGNIIMIGAMFNDSCRGQVRVYEYDEKTNDWNQLGQDINGEAGEVVNERVGDLSGKSVSMSSDGLTIAIGAPNNQKNEDYYYTGHVRIYSFQRQQWVQILNDIDGSTDGDTLGYSVSLSGNGHQLAIGVPGNADVNARAGQVRVYKADLPVTLSPTKSPTHAPTASPTKSPSYSPTLPIIEPQTIQVTYTLGFKNPPNDVPYNAATLQDGNVHDDVMDALKTSIFSVLMSYINSNVGTAKTPSYKRNLSSQVLFEIASPSTSIMHRSIKDILPCPEGFTGSDTCVTLNTDITVLFNAIQYKSNEVEDTVMKILESTMSSSDFSNYLNVPDVIRLAFGSIIAIQSKGGISTNTIIVIASSSLVGVGAILFAVRKIRSSSTEPKCKKRRSPKEKIDDDIHAKTFDLSYDSDFTRKSRPPVQEIMRPSSPGTYVSGLTTTFAPSNFMNQNSNIQSTQSRPKLRLPENFKDLDDDFSDDGQSYDVSYIPSQSQRSIPEQRNHSLRPFSAADSVTSVVSYASALILPLKQKLRDIEEHYSPGRPYKDRMNGHDSDSIMTLSHYFGLERTAEKGRELNFHFNEGISIDDEASENNSIGRKRLT